MFMFWAICYKYFILQLRFAGDLLMELGAGVELVTAAVPHLFLPLACAANVAKVWKFFSNMVFACCSVIFLALISLLFVDRMLVLLHQHQLAHQFTKPLLKERTLEMSLLKENVLAILQIWYACQTWAIPMDNLLAKGEYDDLANRVEKINNRKKLFWGSREWWI